MAESAVQKKFSKAESGHAKNVANFGALITACEGFGGTYNPSSTSISIANLKSIKQQLDQVIAQVSSSESPYKNAVNKRQEAYEGMGKLATRVSNALAAVGTEREVKNAGTVLKRLRGGGKLKAVDAKDDAKSKSNSQMSFDSRVKNFQELTALLGGIPAYQPNETELNLTTLNRYASSLPALSESVNRTADALTQSRITRDKLLYTKNSGAVDLGLTAKKYVKSVFGASSREFKMVSKIELKNQKVK